MWRGEGALWSDVLPQRLPSCPTEHQRDSGRLPGACLALNYECGVTELCRKGDAIRAELGKKTYFCRGIRSPSPREIKRGISTTPSD